MRKTLLATDSARAEVYQAYAAPVVTPPPQSVALRTALRTDCAPMISDSDSGEHSRLLPKKVSSFGERFTLALAEQPCVCNHLQLSELSAPVSQQDASSSRAPGNRSRSPRTQQLRPLRFSLTCRRQSCVCMGAARSVQLHPAQALSDKLAPKSNSVQGQHPAQPVKAVAPNLSTTALRVGSDSDTCSNRLQAIERYAAPVLERFRRGNHTAQGSLGHVLH